MFQFWHFCTLVQYKYEQIPLLVLAFYIAHTGIGISALWFSTGLGTANYRYWHSKMVPVPLLAFLHFDSVPTWAQSINATAFKNASGTGIGIFVLWFSISIGTPHY